MSRQVISIIEQSLHEDVVSQGLIGDVGPQDVDPLGAEDLEVRKDDLDHLEECHDLQEKDLDHPDVDLDHQGKDPDPQFVLTGYQGPDLLKEGAVGQKITDT